MKNIVVSEKGVFIINDIFKFKKLDQSEDIESFMFNSARDYLSNKRETKRKR